MGKDPAMKRLEQASRASSGGENSPEARARLQKQIDEAQKQIGHTDRHAR